MSELLICRSLEICVHAAEATRFDTATYPEHIRSVFDILKIPLSSWTVCYISDSCSVNKRIAEVLNVIHIGCTSNFLNLEVELMAEKDTELKSCITSDRNTTTDCRYKLRNRAMLRNLTSRSYC